MDFQEMVMPFILNNPKIKSKIETIFNQPADHVFKAFNDFIDNVRKGPGIVDNAAKQQQIYNRIFQGGLAMGFTDWESELMAASIAGYTPMDVCLSFRNNRDWKDTTVDKVTQMMDVVAPRFIKKARDTGLLPKESEIPEKGIPKCERTNIGGIPPWETEEFKAKQAEVTDTTQQSE